VCSLRSICPCKSVMYLITRVPGLAGCPQPHKYWDLKDQLGMLHTTHHRQQCLNEGSRLPSNVHLACVWHQHAVEQCNILLCAMHQHRWQSLLPCRIQQPSHLLTDKGDSGLFCGITIHSELEACEQTELGIRDTNGWPTAQATPSNVERYRRHPCQLIAYHHEWYVSCCLRQLCWSQTPLSHVCCATKPGWSASRHNAAASHCYGPSVTLCYFSLSCTLSSSTRPALGPIQLGHIGAGKASSGSFTRHDTTACIADTTTKILSAVGLIPFSTNSNQQVCLR
jgi:hypothetical protein